jgi:hypothetical protein
LAVGVTLHKVIAPPMIDPLGTKSDAGAIIEPQPGSWGFLAGTFKPSSRQIRLTTASLACHPAPLSSPLNVRYP